MSTEGRDLFLTLAQQPGRFQSCNLAINQHLSDIRLLGENLGHTRMFECTQSVSIKRLSTLPFVSAKLDTNCVFLLLRIVKNQLLH